MELRVLRYFLTVVREENISRAAEILHITQPTLSWQLAQLEEELGVPLFYTFDRRQHPTDGGLRLLEGGCRLMDVYQQTLEEVKASTKQSAGSFTLGLSPLFGACFFGDLIPSFSATSSGERPASFALESTAFIVTGWRSLSRLASSSAISSFFLAIFVSMRTMRSSIVFAAITEYLQL